MVGLRGIRLPATPQNAGQGSQAWADPALVPGPRPHRPESWTAWGLWKGHKAPVPAPPHSRSQGGWATHLGCHKVGGVARCHEEPILSPQLLGKAEVTDAQALGVPRLIHIQDVAGLEVPVHDLGAEGPGESPARVMRHRAEPRPKAQVLPPWPGEWATEEPRPGAEGRGLMAQFLAGVR